MRAGNFALFTLVGLFVVGCGAAPPSEVSATEKEPCVGGALSVAEGAGGWQLTPELEGFVDNPMTAVMPDGRLLLASGFAERRVIGFSPEPGRVEALPPVVTPRRWGGLLLLRSGELLLVGGSADSLAEYINPPPELLRPGATEWTQLPAAPPLTVAQGATFELENSAVVAVSPSGKAVQLDPDRTGWTERAVVPPEGSHWFVGFRLPDGTPALMASNGALAVHDRQSGEWKVQPGWNSKSVTGPMYGTVLPDGDLLFVDADRTAVRDASTGVWEFYEPPFATAGTEDRRGVVGTLLSDGRALVTEWAGTKAALFDPATLRWSQAANLHEARVWGPSLMPLPDGRAALVGGISREEYESGRTPTSSPVEIFDPHGASVADECTGP